MGYKVIHYFEDLQDFNHAYKVGDVFPRLGMVVTEDRLRELSSKYNRQKKPLIEFVEEVAKEKKSASQEETVLTKTQINRMALAELREVARASGVKNVDKVSGSELKKVLIREMGL